MEWYVYAAVISFLALRLYLRFSEKPVELKPLVPKAYTLEELKSYTKDPIYIAVRDKVYDVTSGSTFYGEDGPYGKLAGRDATFALAKMETDPDKCESTLNDSENKVLSDWIAKFDSKYAVVGYISKK